MGAGDSGEQGWRWAQVSPKSALKFTWPVPRVGPGRTPGGRSQECPTIPSPTKSFTLHTQLARCMDRGAALGVETAALQVLVSEFRRPVPVWAGSRSREDHAAQPWRRSLRGCDAAVVR
uniref:Uncharacterized protein n=1 Tax=Rangifer tarandus platyrhynchus TaxID=3082113 RepID=A0ACB0E6F2_RANTA|nr:unnamed protein product [Rangifer tarandus platyrhynchus]